MDAKTLFANPTEENFCKYIESGKDINAKNKNKNTLLHLAIDRKFVDIARMLIDKGADIDAKTRNANRPLHYAVYHNLIDVVRILINKGATINVKNKNGDTPLHLAIDRKFVDIARMLIDHHADINTKNNNSNRPLHYAIHHKVEDIVRLLIDKGVDINVKNKNKNTPLHFAIDLKLVDITRLLINKGADIDAKNINGWIPSMIKYEREEYRNLLDNLIKFVSKIIIPRKIDGKPRLRFRPISLGSSCTGLFYRYANTVKDLYVKELQSMATSLGCNSVMTKRGYCKYIAERLESYTRVCRCNRYRSVIGTTVILQNEVDFLHEPIEDSRELYILLDTNGRYYGFSRSDYQYLEMCKINPHSTSRLTEEQMVDMNSFFKKFDGIDCSVYDNLI